MQESFRGVTTQLNPKNSSGGVVRVKEIVKLLKKLKDEIGSSQKALYNKLANIIDSSKDPEKLVQACGQNNKIFENLKKAYDESLSTNSAPENEKKEKTKTTDTQSTAKTAKK